MKHLLDNYGFSARLLFGLLILVLITTFSAGLPAYGLIQTQLELQTWSQVNTIHYASLSLFQAQKDQLETLAFLLVERPTLRYMLDTQTTAELQQYLEAFRGQSQLDLLLLCDEQHRPLAGNIPLITRCPASPSAIFDLIDSRPVLLVGQPIYRHLSDRQTGTVVIGVWLDEEFLRQMAANTGGQHSILRPDGTRLVSNFTSEPAVSTSKPALVLTTQRALDLK